MEEDTEDILSRASQLLARSNPTMASSSGVDLSTRKSQFVHDVLSTFKDIYKDESVAVIRRWNFEMFTWATLKLTETEELPEICFPTIRDDRLTALACRAAFMSIEIAMRQLYLGTRYRYCGAKRTIQCIHEAVLACYDLLCKNLLIEKSWDVAALRSSMTWATNLAIDYLSTETDKLHFKADVVQDNFMLYEVGRSLTGTFGYKDFFSEKDPSTKTMDDGVVGLSGDVMKIKERIVGSQTKLDIIPIVGMGGIGKTTLASKAYKDPEIMLHFHIRAWIVVSREFRERDVLLGLLQSIAPLPDEVYKEDTEELAEKLYRRLKGWRYFIVLDDVWTTKAWDHLKICFPDDNKGSRIVLTSRITEVASHVDPKNPPHVMNFLSIEDSWDLLRRKVYGKDACPHQLENIGMQIAEKCQGLPLAIEVVAGHLSNISKTRECWEGVAKRVGFPTEVTQMESLSNILSISYSDLPHHLKACFLTMVNFPKNFGISVEKLIRLWTAMGFLPQKFPNSVEEVTMEEVAMKCFENLIGRSLIVVKKKKFDGKAKLCGIHDLLWDLSMREFRKEGQCIFRNNPLRNADYMNSSDDDRKSVIGISQTLLYFDQTFESDYPINIEGFELLKVLDILNQSFDHFPVHITDLVNLRYLALATSDNIPGVIYKLSNLETLLNYHERAGQMLPKEIWLLARLRHLHVGTCTYLSDPPSVGFEGSCESRLPNLQSLSDLNSASCTKEVFLNIPNLKQLGIQESGGDDAEDELLCAALENLVNLRQLEILRLYFSLEIKRPRRIPDWGSFLPNTITKLTLDGGNVPWSEVNTLAMLPNLEVLKLKQNAFKGEEWEMDDEQFLQLKCLLLDSLDLTSWKANSDNFPVLQSLCIRACYHLCRIPREFGEIDTLELIDLEFCNELVRYSAVEIQMDQMAVGNDKFILNAGRSPPQLQTMGFLVIFVWMAMKLNTLKPLNVFNLKRGYQKRKKANPPQPKAGK